ncbi:CAP domain-containing protein [Streptomyces erythrochromogenes]|uniref:CAP domain-containing protein n=1 Tax=Streptomyces erythrochromogenes TaxID=285574 RepID=UPI0004CD6B49|nr:CAP domain-containing protein [Streptomyces erythrochromogenes]MCX5588314.1 CAP domain-containing protein [Streptomyces erythrochromogenes]
MSRSRTPETQTRVEARRKKTVRTRIVLSVTTAAAVVAVGVAVADSGDEARTDRRTDAAGTSSGTATPTPDAAPPTTDAPTTTSASASATPDASASASATPTDPATAESSTPAKSESSPSAKPPRKPATTTGGGSGSTGGSGGSTGGGGGTVNGDAESAVLALVNKERAAAGCGALTSNPKLSAAARGYSDTMARAGVMSHTGPDGSTMTSRVEAAGYKWSNLGENIARGQADADAVMKAWMNSSGHRANILNCAFKEIGIGVHKGDGGPWWTQNFGAPR